MEQDSNLRTFSIARAEVFSRGFSLYAAQGYFWGAAQGNPQTRYTRVWGCGSGTQCFRSAATVEMHDGGGGLVTQSCPTLETPQTVARQALLSVGFSRQEYWNELPFPSPGDLPDRGIKPASPALQANC